MKFPLPENFRGRVSQAFGVPNRHYKSGIHNGVDIPCPIGTPITAPSNGRIYRVYREDRSSMGIAAYFKCENGIYMRFLHCDYTEDVQDVVEGQFIGRTGNTGDSEGPHLHWEAWKVPISAALLYSERSVRENLIDPLTLV